MRGFFLYALQIIHNGKDLKILTTNLKPSFWRNLKTILRQNKKQVLLQFLFGSQSTDTNRTDITTEFQNLKERIESLQNQVNSLQDRICDLETTPKNFNYPLSDTRKPSETIQTTQLGDSTLKPNMGLYLQENDTQINSQVQDPGNAISTSLSEASRSSVMTSQPREESNIPSTSKRGLNGSNFITLGNISEQEKIEIIQTGFQLQADGKISLKKYYEGTDPNSLFQSKGYSIKYESIRRTKLYSKLKP